MNKLVSLAIIAVLIIALPIQASALTLFGIGPRGGYYQTENQDGKMYVGGAARIKLGGLGFEGAIDYRSEDLAGSNITLKSVPISASVLLYPVPYVYGVGGFGWYNSTMEYTGNLPLFQGWKESTQDVGYHFGGGLEIPLGGLTVAADIRYVFLDYDFKVAPTSDEIDSDFYAITISLLWGF